MLLLMGRYMDIYQQLTAEGYQCVRVTTSGKYVGVMGFIYTAGLCIGLDKYGYERRYCYATKREAIAACTIWDGNGDPPGNWIKMKSAKGEKINPLIGRDPASWEA